MELYKLNSTRWLVFRGIKSSSIRLHIATKKKNFRRYGKYRPLVDIAVI